MECPELLHPGEVELQKKAGTHSLAKQLICKVRDRLPEEWSKMLNTQPIMFLAHVDGAGQVWVSPLCGDKGWVEALDDEHLAIRARGKTAIPRCDPLLQSLLSRSPPLLSINCLRFRTRKRIRVSGTVERMTHAANKHVMEELEEMIYAGQCELPGASVLKPAPSEPREASVEVLGVPKETVLPPTVDVEMIMHVEEAFEICPKYIQQRIPHPLTRPASQHDLPPSIETTTELTASQIKWVATADTMMIGTFHPGGNLDSSHRGGYPGFIQVVSPNELFWSDYRGTGVFQTFGNLVGNPSCGLLFLDFEDTGHYLQLTGRAEVEWLDSGSDVEGGQHRILRYKIDAVNEIRAPSLSQYRFTLVDPSPYCPPINMAISTPLTMEALKGMKIPEPRRVDRVKLVRKPLLCRDARIFGFATSKPLKYLPGQYGVYLVPVPGRRYEHIIRNWTITSIPSPGKSQLEHAIKRVPEGAATPWMFDALKEGGELELMSIQGSFTIFDHPTHEEESADRQAAAEPSQEGATIPVSQHEARHIVSSVPSSVVQGQCIPCARDEQQAAGSAKLAKLLFLTAGVGITPIVANLRGIISRRFPIRPEFVVVPEKAQAPTTPATPGRLLRPHTLRQREARKGQEGEAEFGQHGARREPVEGQEPELSLKKGTQEEERGWDQYGWSDEDHHRRRAELESKTEEDTEALAEDILGRAGHETKFRVEADVLLIHSCHGPDDVPRAYLKEARESWLHENKRLRIILYLTRCKELSNADADIYDVADAIRFGHLNEQALRHDIPDPATRVCLLCGPRGFMESLSDALVDIGITEDRIKTESFEY